MRVRKSKQTRIIGGQGGIRTHEPLARLPDFECCINTFSKGKINTDKKLQKELKTLIYSGFSAPFLLLLA